MKKIWSAIAWEEYLYWQNQDKKTLKRINLLIKDIERNGNYGRWANQNLLAKIFQGSGAGE
jgi:Txe/YoeB family toxin of Txe-Axe toxin-antitoxin module